jgi:hypothetical protein
MKGKSMRFSTPLLMAVVLVFAACGGKSDPAKPPEPGKVQLVKVFGPYPFRYEGHVPLYVSSTARTIKQGGRIYLQLSVFNGTTDNITHGLVLSVTQAPDGTVPYKDPKILKYIPEVTSTHSPIKSEWKVGGLPSGREKSWTLEVQLPHHIVNSATRFCFAGSVEMSADSEPWGSWSRAAEGEKDNGDLCLPIVR